MQCQKKKKKKEEEEEEEEKKKKKKKKEAGTRILPLTCNWCLVKNEWTYSSTPECRHGVVRDKFNYSKKMERRWCIFCQIRIFLADFVYLNLTDVY
jgi:hypothetical protein